MNLGTLTDDLFARLDWSPTPTTKAVSIAHRFINRALSQVVLDAPFLFYEDRFIIRTQPDVAPTVATDTITLVQDDVPGGINNPWMFEVDLAQFSTPGQVVFPFNREWDGRWIEIEDDNGVKRRTRIRSITERTNAKGVNTFITLWNPWSPTEWGNGPYANWRIYTQDYYLPDDVVEVKSLRLVNDGQPYPLQFLGQSEAEELGLSEHAASQSGGTPTVAYRSGYFRMKGPKVAPSVAADIGEPPDFWEGPEPAGQFQYRVTYCWGRRDVEWANPGPHHWNHEKITEIDIVDQGESWIKTARNRVVEPMWESAPSPASAVYTVALPAQGAVSAPMVTLPNIEYMLGFLTDIQTISGPFERLNVALSGWYVRIYRRRLTEDFTNYSALATTSTGRYVPALAKMDFDDNYYLIAETKIDDVNQGRWLDDGTIQPDIHRPLRRINGYEAIRFSPQPDGEALLEGRALRQPPTLVSEQDAPHVKPEASDLILERALAYTYERLGDTMKSQDAERRYEKVLGQVKRRYGDGIPGSQALRRRPTRFPLVSRHPRWRR